MLRLVPIALLGMAIVGILQIAPMIFKTYIHRDGNTNSLLYMAMTGDMLVSMRFVFIGIIPLIAYLIYIFYYVMLDLIRAILQLPGKLDALKK